MKLEKFFQTRVGDGGDGGGGDDGRISPEHPSPILHAPRDIISRKGQSLTPIYIYISIMSAKADREVGGGGGDARLKGSLALVQKVLQLTSTHNNSLRTL